MVSAAAVPVSHVVGLMASGHSRLPVLGDGVDDVVGVICLRDLLGLTGPALEAVLVRAVARPAVMVPASLPLPTVLQRLRQADDEFACVVDEYGGLAGVITVEDLAEELVGEITDEHDPAGEDQASLGEDGGWLLLGAAHIDEVERLLGHDLPDGDFQTIGGLVIHELQRLPEPGDAVTVDLPRPPGAEDDQPPPQITVAVCTVDRHVPDRVRLTVHDGLLDGAASVEEVDR